jgi:hypothetical protein
VVSLQYSVISLQTIRTRIGNLDLLTTDDRGLTTAANKKATLAKGRPSLLGRIVPTGAKIRQNFLAKSYEPKKGGVKGFLGNKYL